MKQITKSQIITIHTLLRAKGLQDEKPRVITEASNGRTSSCSQLYFNEAMQLINTLNGKGQQVKKDDPRQKMFNHIIAMANEIGFVKPFSAVDGSGQFAKKKDYTDLHKWIKKFGYLHKDMNDYKYNELPKLVTQFKEVYSSRMKIK